MSSQNETPTVGIYIGTENLCVGVWYHGRVEIVADGNGCHTTPAYVAFTESERLVGAAAKNQIDINPTNTVYDIRKLIGRRFSDPCVQSGITLWPFRVVAGPNDATNVAVKYKRMEKQFSAEELLSMLLEKMKKIAEAFLLCTVKNAVITVPAYFNDAQRRATKEACTIASLHVLQIIDEPIAVSMAYTFYKCYPSSVNEKNFLIFHLGGATFDVSIVNINDKIVKLKATVGDSHLGGDDFTNRMVEHFIKEFRRKHRIDITNNVRSLRRLKSHCEGAKKRLSYAAITRVEVDCFYGGVDVSAPMTQARFEELNMDLFVTCMDLMNKCLIDAEVDKNNVDFIALVGGSTRIPKIQMLLQDFFHGKEILKCINSEEVVAYGAAIHAAKLNNQLNPELYDLIATHEEEID